MGLFSISFENVHILLAVDYMFMRVEASLTKTNEARVVVKLLRENIFSKNSMPLIIISDQGTHFNDRSFVSLLRR